MGVPGLFANLCNIYKKYIIIDNADISTTGKHIRPNVLLFDFNCLIHPVSRIVMNEYNSKITNIPEFELNVIKRSIQYMESVINYCFDSSDTTTKICGIFIDGVCPMSKIVQQRQRRFSNIIYKDVVNNIKSKYKNDVDDINNIYYDTNSITPGTEFMDKLDKYIIEYIQSKHSNPSNSIQFIYSSFTTIGEGEHKIINYIKREKELLKDKIISVYGLDADLIILNLTLLNYALHIYLLREEKDIHLEQLKMIYFDIYQCARCITKSLNYKLTNIETLNETDTIDLNRINDFIFITILLGNDFIHPCPSVNMRVSRGYLNGYVKLIDAYNRTIESLNSETNYIVSIDHSIQKIVINWEIYKIMLSILATDEEQYFIELKNHNKYINKQCVNIIDIKINNFDNLIFSIPDPIKLSNPNIPYNIRKQRFIHHYFGNSICNCSSNNINYESQLLNTSNTVPITDTFYNDKFLHINQSNYNNIIDSYISTFSYVMYYYYFGCPDYHYHLHLINSILISDFSNYINNCSNIHLNSLFDKFHNRINQSTNITPLIQLMLVLPIKSFNLLPREVLTLLETNKNDILIKNYISFFPKSIKHDFLYKTKLFQCPINIKLPLVDVIIGILIDLKVHPSILKRLINS